MSAKEIIDFLGDDWARVNELLRGALSTDVKLLDDTNLAVLSHSGKMLRPMICLLLSRAMGGCNEDSLKYAAAVELLHNATLMHDDVADESLQRRGTPTVSALLGPSAAVLVGDFWLARAVELVLDTAHYGKVVKYFSSCLTDLAQGELLQMEKACSADTQEDDYFKIIKCKTATLFRVAGVAAASSVDACEPLLGAAESYATSLGMAFQIKDDILDYDGTSTLGKPTGVDLKEKKITLPLLGALKDCPDQSRYRSMLLEVDSKPENISVLRDFVLEHRGMEYAKSRLEEYIDNAVKALDAFEDSTAKRYLADIARFNSFRQL
ncbi:MAG: polyprenyl synthetase family protein [Candidatus Cryptobacteroides sp.]